MFTGYHPPTYSAYVISNLKFWFKFLTQVLSAQPQGPEKMCLLLAHQNPSKTSGKMGYFDRVTVSLHILYTANQETEGSQDRLTV